ncbi:unnamed protein product [Anisakis simplex]|uniref:Ubiquitin-like domain-containing protein n=1 Tax=Anisakis simplex TaxID=6269 RepID=A0A0M3JUP0_ANISI|nr:unnamed protein product [Anisakis simplex]
MGKEGDSNEGEMIALLIRCAMQSFEDTSVTCPINWTVRQLKEKLAVVCSSKPEADRQRLIYAGHCLQDDKTLRSVFENRVVESDNDIRVIHLVCPCRDLAEFDGLRRRNVKEKKDQNERNSTDMLPSAPTHPTSSANAPNSAATGWPNFAAARNYGVSFPVSQYGADSNAQLHSAYNAYAMYYTNYMQQMMTAMNGSNAPFVANTHSYVAPHFSFPTTAPVTQPVQPADRVAADVVAAPAAAPAGGIVQEAVAGEIEAPQRDFLDIVHKAIRICFLVMLVYVYSSAERFLGVLLFIILVWFVQARRDRNNRQRADRELVHAVNNVRRAQQVDEVENETTPRDSGMGTSSNAGSESNENREPTAWTIFWSTCYTFITSFFTSLIPDNPVPVNMN